MQCKIEILQWSNHSWDHAKILLLKILHENKVKYSFTL